MHELCHGILLSDDNINEMNSIAEMEAFRYGVRFGIRLMMETGGSLECPSA